MKQLLSKLDKAFENKIRLGIMLALTESEQLDFTTLRKLLDVSDGNLASHLKSLEKIDYIEIRKRFIGRKPNTSYFVSIKGKEAFEEYIATMRSLIKS